MRASNGLDPVLEMPLWAAPSRRIKQRSESDLWWWVSRAWCSIWPLTSMAHKRGGNDRRPWNQNLCPQPCTATFGHRHLLKKNISDEQHNKRDFQLLQSPMGDGENNNNNDMTMIIILLLNNKDNNDEDNNRDREAIRARCSPLSLSDGWSSYQFSTGPPRPREIPSCFLSTSSSASTTSMWTSIFWLLWRATLFSVTQSHKFFYICSEICTKSKP